MSVLTNYALILTKIDFVLKKVYLKKALVCLTNPQISGDSQWDWDFLLGLDSGLLSLDTETKGTIAVAWQHSWRTCPLLSYKVWAWVV
jgi:hypothetical protein